MLTNAQSWILLAGLVLAGWLLYLLSPVLSPFLVAAILAYLGDPIVDRLEERRVPRVLAVVLVFGVMFSLVLVLLVILIPLIQAQLFSLLARIPQVIDWLQSELLPLLSDRLNIQAESINIETVRQALQEHWQGIGDVLGYLIARIGSSGAYLVAWVSYLILVPVVTFYLLLDWDKLMHHIRSLIPVRYQETVTRIAAECDQVLAQFLRGQLLVMLALAVMYAFGLWLMGLEFSLLIGFGAGLISFVPYLGSIVGVAVAGIMALIQFQDILHLILVGVVFGIGQSVEGMLLSPWLVGDRIGLHPVAVIFAVMAGGQLFGFMGILLALPVAAVVTVLLRHLHARYTNSDFYTP